MMSDSDGTASQLFNNDGRIVVENSTQDIILTSNGAEDFNWIVGLSAVQDSYDLQHFTVRNFEAFGGAGLDLRFRGITEASAYAAFFEGAYDLTDKLTITLGGRYTYEKKEADIARVFYHMDDGSLFVGPLSFEGKKSWSVFKPRAIIDYEIENNWTAYASISTGFKSGGYNVFGATDEAFDDEGIISYEIGSKGRFFDERLGLSAALFYYDYTELQLRLGVPEGGVVIQNASDAEIFGAEAEWDLELGNGLSLYGSVSFLESELIDYTTRDLSGSLVNAGGNNMARAPEFQYTLGADYELTVSNDKFLRLSSSVSHRSEVFFLETDQDADTFRGKPLTEVDIRVTYGAEDESWEVSAIVQNATNEVEVAQVELQGNFPQATFNDPRKAGVEFTRRF
jgi:iron complex outermembrane receptor protein